MNRRGTILALLALVIAMCATGGDRVPDAPVLGPSLPDGRLLLLALGLGVWGWRRWRGGEA